MAATFILVCGDITVIQVDFILQFESQTYELYVWIYKDF